jgi:hypothetical protein
VAPAITTQPVNKTVTAPATATFSVVATGTPTPTYAWQSAPSGSSTFTAISGATSTSYTTGATTTAMSGTKYRCVITNTAGSVISSVATLTVNAGQDQPGGGFGFSYPNFTGATGAMTAEQFAQTFSATMHNPNAYRQWINSGTHIRKLNPAGVYLKHLNLRTIDSSQREPSVEGRPRL